MGDVIEVRGTIVNIEPNNMYEVELETRQTVTCHLSGKQRMNYVKIEVGQEVTVELSPYDLTKGRITQFH